MSKNQSQCSKYPNPVTDRVQPIDNRFGKSIRAEIYPDESPTRDRWQSEEEKRISPRCDFYMTPEDKMKEYQRNVCGYPANLCPTIMGRMNQLPSVYNNNMPAVNRRHNMDMETQAAVPTASKEMITVPRTPPEVRNVAVFVSPASSSSSRSNSQQRRLKIIQHSKSISIQTQISNVLNLQRKSVQTCFSSYNIRKNQKVRHKRKSKSQVDLKIDNYLDEQMVQIIQNKTKPSVHLRNKLKKQRKHKHEKNDPKFKIDKCENDQILFSERNLKEFTRELSDDLLSKIRRQNIFLQPNDRYRANYFEMIKRNYEQCFIDEILVEWLNDVPIKSTDYVGKPVAKESILETVSDKVQNILKHKLYTYNSEASIKADIIDILEDIPIDVTGHTRRFLLNKLVIELMSKIKYSSSKKLWKKIPAFCNSIQSLDIQPLDDEMKQFIENEVVDLQRKFSLLICNDTVGQMINELTVIMLDSMEAIRHGKICDVIDDILTITSEFLTISEFQSTYFAHNLVYNLFQQQSSCIEPRSYDFICYSSQIEEKIPNNTDSSEENETEHENTDKWSDFSRQIAVQVNEWLSTISGNDDINHCSRNVIVKNLTNDIVHRQQYLELNPNASVDELEHLKYQIFKWVNKVLGENNMDTLAKAPDLMTRIKSVPVTRNEPQEEAIMPKRTSERSSIKPSIKPVAWPTAGPSTAQPQGEANMPKPIEHSSNKSRIRPVALQTSIRSDTQSKSTKQLNEEFDAYVKDWVQRVPIAVSKPEEEATAEKARLGLYIAVWKAITKLKMSPEALDNPYYYQDALDDELEILLLCLPQTPEFKAKKHVLKPELIEKTMIFNERVANVAGDSSYRQQLVENVNNRLPKQTDINIAGKNTDRLYEEWQKNMLAELYIVYNRFKIDDRVKAMAYKRKLMQHVEKMIDNIKATTKQELKEIDHHTYQDVILTALDEVPVPSDETLNKEAGEILFLLEVEQWYGDLPLQPSKRKTANIEAKVFQDLLARKLYDIDAHCDPTNRPYLMKQEIRRFLERLPLREEEKPNINFMIEELLNRLNNVDNDVIVVGGENERKSIHFLEGYDYDAFSRNRPVSSTFEGNPPRDPYDGSSYFISEGARVPDDQGWQTIRDPTGRSEQYLTIEGLTGPRMTSNLASSALPQNEVVPPDNQFRSFNQGSFLNDQTKNDYAPNGPGSRNNSKNGHRSSRSIQIMEDPVSNLTNRNQSGFGSAAGYDPNRSQPPPVDINPRPQDVDCCGIPTPQDKGAYGMSGPNTPCDYRAPGTCSLDMSSRPQSGAGYKPRPQQSGLQQSGPNVTPTPQDYRESAISRPQSGTMPRPQQSGPNVTLTPQGFRKSARSRPRSGSNPNPPRYEPSAPPQDQRESLSSRQIDLRSFVMPRPTSSSTPNDIRTTERGTDPIPRTLESGTNPAYGNLVQQSAPPSYKPSRQYTSVPPMPDEYTPYSTPDNETPQTPRKNRKDKTPVRRKLSFADSENETDSDYNCRCMEKIWRCRKRKPCDVRYIPCEEMPCFMRMREPCYYRP